MKSQMSPCSSEYVNFVEELNRGSHIKNSWNGVLLTVIYYSWPWSKYGQFPNYTPILDRVIHSSGGEPGIDTGFLAWGGTK